MLPLLKFSEFFLSLQLKNDWGLYLKLVGVDGFIFSYFSLLFIEQDLNLIASTVKFRQVLSSQVIEFSALTFVFPFSVWYAARALSC